VVSFTPQLLYRQGKTPWYPLDRRLGGFQSRSGHGGEENNAQLLPELEPPIIQPVAQCYTTELFQLRGDSDSDHYLVVAKIRHRLSVSKQAAQRFDSEKFNFEKLNGVEVKEQYQVKISHRFAALENLDDDDDDDVTQTVNCLRINRCRLM
jgi:hypothetical protein